MVVCECFLVGSECVDSIIVTCTLAVAKVIETGTGIPDLNILVGIFAELYVITTLFVSCLIETIGKVGSNGQLFDGADIDASGICEVGLTVDVGVLAVDDF